jgi:phosphocarrier protein FPr
MRARAGDVRDVGNRVLRHLLGVEAPLLDMAQPSVVLAGDLTPSDTAQFSPNTVLAVCTEGGGATSHSAILSRALGIPAVVGLGPALAGIEEGTIIAVDGSAGRVWPDPAPERLEALLAAREAWLSGQAEAKARGQEEAVTADGHRVEVAANIGGPHDVDIALEYGAEGIGLFRTEFLFLERESAPTEEEQYEAYRHVARKMGQKPVIIRTLDIGGDKPIPYLDMAEEANPFLGWRGIRFCLDHPELFVPQLRAILRAAHGHNVSVMFPMVSTVEEVRAARRLLDQVKEELREEGIAHEEHLALGIMIEVPAAVAIADQLAAEVDFFSIGTNDLTQYTMAADRGNRRVAGLARALQPAVLRLIAQTVAAAHKAGIWVGLCGELGGNASATSLLLGLGLDELSMNAPSIPAVKEAVRHTTVAEAKEKATVVLGHDTAEEVEETLAKRTTI